MSGYLLDTNAALIALTEPELLTGPVRTAVLAGPNFLSVVSYWEVMLKSMKGNLLVGDPLTWWREALEQLAAVPLALRSEHVARIYTLPPFHKDPFDRVLIAQAMVEDLLLVTIEVRFRATSPRNFGWWPDGFRRERRKNRCHYGCSCTAINPLATPVSKIGTEMESSRTDR